MLKLLSLQNGFVNVVRGSDLTYVEWKNVQRRFKNHGITTYEKVTLHVYFCGK